MADITNLSSFLGDVADAIRSKKGSEESIPAKNFDEEILSIETGIDTSDADATEENIEEGKTAYVNGLKVTGTLADAGGSADIMVSADNISVGNQRGYDCVSTKYTNSGKKIHKDGWYVNQHMKFEDLAPALGVTADKIVAGNTILGVEGIATGGGTVTTEGVKLFETIEEMQDDSTAEEGDLAVVYKSEIQNATASSQFQVATFPATVVLPSAVADYVDVMYRAVDDSVMFDCWGNLDSNYFMMDCYTETGSIRIQYESSDGITYTRIDDGEETIDFGTEIYYYHSEYWNDAIGYFIQTGGSTFDGLYQYNVNYVTDDYTAFDIDNIDYTNNVLNIPLSNIRIPNDVINGFYDKVCELEGGRTYMWMVATCDADNNLYGYISDSNSSTIPDIYIDIPNKVGYIPSMDGSESSVSSKFIKKYKYIAATKETVLDTFNADYSVYNAKYKAQKLIPDKYFLGRIYKNNMSDPITLTTIRIFGFNDISGDRITDIDMNISSGKYHTDTYVLAPSQLTLIKADELLPGKIAYGKKGIITGDESIYDNLTPNLMFGKWSNADFENKSSFATTRDTNGSAIIDTDTDYEKSLFIIKNITDKFDISGIQSMPASNYDYSVTENFKIISCCANRILTMRVYDKDYKFLYQCSIDFSSESYMGSTSGYLADLQEIDGVAYCLFKAYCTSSYAASIYKILKFTNIEMTTINSSFKSMTGRSKYPYGSALEVYNNKYYVGTGPSGYSLTEVGYHTADGTYTKLYSETVSQSSYNTSQCTSSQDSNYIYMIIANNGGSSGFSKLLAINKSTDSVSSISLKAEKYNYGTNVKLFKQGDVVYLNTYKNVFRVSGTSLTDIGVAGIQNSTNVNLYYTGTKMIGISYRYLLTAPQTVKNDLYDGVMSILSIYSSNSCRNVMYNVDNTYKGSKLIKLPSGDMNILEYELHFDKCLGDDETSKLKVLKWNNTQPYRYIILSDITESANYTGTISPEEYNEINAMAEDVLGGVE